MKSLVPASDRFWTIPNVLSIFRVILIIPIINQLKLNTPESNFMAFILIGIAYLTDFLDGFLARTLKSTSKVGQILDPVGDKLLAITVSAVLYISKRYSILFFYIDFTEGFYIFTWCILCVEYKKNNYDSNADR